MSVENEVLIPLTRKELYSLAEQCRAYAVELAGHDQNRVSLKHCHEFNRWLPKLKTYDLLAADLEKLKAARPIARWQVMTISVFLWLLLFFALPDSPDRTMRTVLFSTSFLVLVCIYLIPERFYGTTIELVEGKVLYVVELLEQHLLSGVPEFSEAAFHRVKENLQEARRELRQQIDLAYRARSRH